MKKCQDCGSAGPLRGTSSYCLPCHRKRYYPKEKKRDATLRQRYGISQKEYEYLYRRQDGRCAICERKKARLAVDHCHKTGIVRGLLCDSCNQILGIWGDRLQCAENAVSYLGIWENYAVEKH
jgi:RecJ-like exonuclease